MTEAEKIAVLETQREEHEKRHDRFEKDIEAKFTSISTQFAAGSKKFDTLMLQQNSMKIMLEEHCKNSGQGQVCNTKKSNGSETKKSNGSEVVITIKSWGKTLGWGGGAIAILLLIIEAMQGSI